MLFTSQNWDAFRTRGIIRVYEQTTRFQPSMGSQKKGDYGSAFLGVCEDFVEILSHSAEPRPKGPDTPILRYQNYSDNGALDPEP